MDSTIHDEIVSINAIYGEDTLAKDPAADSDFYLLKITSTDVVLRLSFPSGYPDDAPTILGPDSSGSDVRKGAAHEIASLAREALSECFTPGVPCIFDLVEQISGSLPPATQQQGQQEPLPDSDDKRSGPTEPQNHSTLELIEAPSWTLSDVIAEKKSVFVGRAAHVTHPDQAQLFVRHLVATDKKVAKATHNITAWRIKGSHDVAYQDCDDDGEAAAGGRLLHLLQIMDVWDAVVVVSRWYGGVKLGPDRFRLINGAARDALAKGGFDKETHRRGQSHTT